MLLLKNPLVTRSAEPLLEKGKQELVVAYCVTTYSASVVGKRANVALSAPETDV